MVYRYMKENLSRALSAANLNDFLGLEVTHHMHCAATEEKLSQAAFKDRQLFGLNES